MDVINEADNTYWTYIAVRDKVKLMQIYIDMMNTSYSQTETAVEDGIDLMNQWLL